MTVNSLAYIKDKSVLITGGTGSIGKELLYQVLAAGAKVVRVFSRNEYAQYLLGIELKQKSFADRTRLLLGDVRDRDRVLRASTNIEIIFHCAALKHVTACEFNPFEAVKTNVIGTQNIVEAAIQNNVERFVAISTDKAVSPTNTMGATKLLAERLVTSAEYYKGNCRTRFSAVRFGNVLGSSGSVIPLFIDQIRNGGPVTLTHREMLRFFMSIPDAVKLVLRAGAVGKGGEVFILKMPVMNIYDLVSVLIELFAKPYGLDPKQIAISDMGVQPGEKLQEELMTEEEGMLAEEFEQFFVINPFGIRSSHKLGNSYKCTDQAKLDKKAIRELFVNTELYSRILQDTKQIR